MFHINNYKIYVHRFPDGKKYVGATSTDVKYRWRGGLGYTGQGIIFDAILKYDWNNIKHYIIMDNLDKEDAMLYEAAFIYSWKTYRRSRGYNTICPNILEAKDINVPTWKECEKIKIDDFYEEPVEDRYKRLYDPKKCRSVRCMETGEVFDSAETAAKEYLVTPGAIYQAAHGGGAAGEYEIIPRYYMPAHWEYVD